MSLLYHAYVYLEFLILACTIYILAPIILLNILLNLLGALGIIPPASSFLPFLSIGRSNILLCYALVGIIMSIYRYKDVYPKKIRASQVSFQKTINI